MAFPPSKCAHRNCTNKARHWLKVREQVYVPLCFGCWDKMLAAADKLLLPKKPSCDKLI